MPKRNQVVVRNSVIIGIIAFILVVSTVVSCVWGNPEEKKEPQPTYLFLGDSIAEALLGPSPISERDSFGYYSIVGQSNNAKYVNRAISGLTTIGFVNSLYTRNYFEEDDAFYREYWIKNADVIFISMLGNDLLGERMVEYAIDTGKKYTSDDHSVCDAFQEKMDNRCIPKVQAGLKKIYELNPNATIIWQTLYNPFTDNSVLLDEDDWTWYYDEIARGNIDEKYTFRELADILVNAINGIVYDYKAQNPDKKFYISDVKSAFDAVFEADQSEGEKLIFSDWIHPSVRGHALIAECLEKTLCELGLSDMNVATERYKKLLSDRMDRIYPDNAAAKSKVQNAKTFSAATSAYFTSTQNLKAEYKPNVEPYKNGNYFSEEKYYELDSLTIDDVELTSIDLAGMAEEFDQAIVDLISLLLPDGIPTVDKNDSYFCFYEDGTFEFALTLDKRVIRTLNVLLNMYWSEIEDFDVIAFYQNEPFCDFNTTYEMYFSELFPDFDPRDLKKSLESLSIAGVTLDGIDTEGENFKNLAASLKETGKIPEGFVIPEYLSLHLNGYYTKEVLGEGKDARTVVYLRLVRTGEDTVPMFCALIGEDDQYETLLFKIEFCSMRVLCKTEK